jgi:hypothetical protein
LERPAIFRGEQTFVHADSEQQSRIATLETLLPTLVEEARTTQAKSPVVDQPSIKINLLDPSSREAPFEDAKLRSLVTTGVEEVTLCPPSTLSVLVVLQSGGPDYPWRSVPTAMDKLSCAIF